jgi:hypothetical protein
MAGTVDKMTVQRVQTSIGRRWFHNDDHFLNPPQGWQVSEEAVAVAEAGL